MGRKEWERRVMLILAHPPQVKSEHLTPFFENDWSPEDTASHIKIQLRGPVKD